MDTILHHSDGLVTSGINLLYAVVVLAGVFLAARYGKSVLKPSLVLLVLAFGVRAFVAPTDIVAVVAMTVLHIVSGCLIGLLLTLRRGKA